MIPVSNLQIIASTEGRLYLLANETASFLVRVEPLGNHWISTALLTVVFSVAFAVLYFVFDGSMIALPLPLVLLFAMILIWMSVEDWLHKSFPVSALVLFLILCVIAGWMLSQTFLVNLVAGLGFGLGFRVIDWLIGKSRGVTALGSGDALLIAGVAILLGPLATAHVILIASLSGLGVTAVRAFSTAHEDRSLPFGPFLAFGTWCLFLEPQLFY